MKVPATLIDFMLKEWLVVTSGVGLLTTSLYVKRFPTYSSAELQVLFILFVLFVTVNGIRESGLILKIAQNFERGKMIPVKLILLTFFLSILITNDVALIVMVPLTLALNIDKKDILIILEALTANAGSALSPIGNPQNLFIYWYYNISPITFVTHIFPFTLLFMIILIIFALFINIKNNIIVITQEIKITANAYIFSILLLMVILTVLHILPIYFCLPIIILSFIFNRNSFRVDYSLLLSFFFFFGFADNIRVLLTTEMHHSQHIFLLSALTSQIMSNVPATLLFARFTTNWNALLWGSNTGGFGSLFGSLANLIAYKIYVTDCHTKNNGTFIVKFIGLGYIFFFTAIALYILLYKN